MAGLGQDIRAFAREADVPLIKGDVMGVPVHQAGGSACQGDGGHWSCFRSPPQAGPAPQLSHLVPRRLLRWGGHKILALHPSTADKEALTVRVASVLVILQLARGVRPTLRELALYPAAWPAAAVLCTVGAEPLLPGLGARDRGHQALSLGPFLLALLCVPRTD